MQQNHLAEHGFVYLATTGCSMMSNANFSIDYTKNAFELCLFLMEINYQLSQEDQIKEFVKIISSLSLRWVKMEKLAIYM